MCLNVCVCCMQVPTQTLKKKTYLGGLAREEEIKGAEGGWRGRGVRQEEEDRGEAKHWKMPTLCHHVSNSVSHTDKDTILIWTATCSSDRTLHPQICEFFKAWVSILDVQMGPFLIRKAFWCTQCDRTNIRLKPPVHKIKGLMSLRSGLLGYSRSIFCCIWGKSLHIPATIIRQILWQTKHQVQHLLR